MLEYFHSRLITIWVNIVFKTVYFQVYIIGHVPPGTMGRALDIQWFTANFNNHFLEILQTYSDCIAAAIFGHEHTDSFRIVYDKKGLLKYVYH